MGFKDNPIVYLTKKTWHFSSKKKIVLFTFLFFLANAVDFFWPLLIGKVLNIVQESGLNPESFGSIIWILAIFPLLTIGFWAFHGPARIIETKNAFMARANYKKYLVDGVMSLPAAWHTDHHSGDTIDRINKSSDALFEYSSHLFEVIQTVIRLIGSYAALVYFNLHSAYIVLFMVIITISIVLKFDSILMPQYTKLFRYQNKISAKIFDIISNVSTVIILRVEDLASKAIVKKIMAPWKLFQKNWKINEFKWAIVSLLSSSMIVFVLISYIWSSLNGAVMIGTIYILYEYVHRINGLFFRFAYKYGQIVRQKTEVENGEFLANFFKEKRVSTKEYVKWKKLKIDSLSFSYSGSKGDEQLNKVDLSITKGEKIALMGESGSGKTTLLKIIRQMYEPRYVNLYADGKILKGGFSKISNQISLVPQDPEIFSTTIKENITVGANFSMKEVEHFAKMAKFHETALTLPKQYDSSIVERGVNLSGGQKQRLALARGLLASKDKTIVLLDEPTSSVDPENELEIYESIFKLFKAKTVISSIHRMHLLPLFDTIYMFKEGKVIGKGSFRELLRDNKNFRLAWSKYTRKTKKK